VWATHYAPAADLFEQQKLKLNDIAWKSKPSWYIVAKADRTVHPDPSVSWQSAWGRANRRDEQQPRHYGSPSLTLSLT